MNPDTLVAHGATLPPWSPFAVATGILLGFLAGVYCMALYALWLQRRVVELETWLQPDPADGGPIHTCHLDLGSPDDCAACKWERIAERLRSQQVAPETFGEEALRA